jgi:hypothetical protein
MSARVLKDILHALDPQEQYDQALPLLDQLLSNELLDAAIPLSDPARPWGAKQRFATLFQEKTSTVDPAMRRKLKKAVLVAGFLAPRCTTPEISPETFKQRQLCLRPLLKEVDCEGQSSKALLVAGIALGSLLSPHFALGAALTPLSLREARAGKEEVFATHPLLSSWVMPLIEEGLFRSPLILLPAHRPLRLIASCISGALSHYHHTQAYHTGRLHLIGEIAKGILAVEYGLSASLGAHICINSLNSLAITWYNCG